MNNPDKPNTNSPYPPPPAGQVSSRFDPSRDSTADHRTVSADARYRASVGDVVHKRGNLETNGRLFSLMLFALALYADKPSAALLVVMGIGLAYLGEMFTEPKYALPLVIIFHVVALAIVAL